MTPEQIEALKWRMVLDLAPNGDHTNFSGAEMLVMGRLIDHLASTGRLLQDGYVAVPYQPELGTATQAIEFAITIDDHYDRLNFLECWQVGDLSEWDDYKAMIAAAKGE